MAIFRRVWVSFWLISVVLVAGCATTPISYSDASPAPSSQILAPELLHAHPGTAKVTVKRDSGFMGSACTYRVFMDGRPIVQLRGGERIDIFIEPGEHVFGALAEGACGGGTAEVAASMSSGQWKSFRIASGQDGTLQFLATAF